MSLTLLEKDMNIISSLEDEPNDVGGMSAAELKAAFDEGNVAVEEFLNNTLIAELEALGVNKLVQYGSDTIKQIRVNEEGGLDVSPDGLVWATISGSSGGTTAIGAVTFNGTTYYPTDYVVTLPSMFVGYGSCSTAIGTKEKTTTIENFALVTGCTVSVLMVNGNSNSAMDLNVSGTGAKNVYWMGSTALPYGIASGSVCTFVYNGTLWNMVACDSYVDQLQTKTKKICCSSSSSAVNSDSSSTSVTASLVVLHDTDGTNSGTKTSLTLPSDATKIQVRMLTSLGRNDAFVYAYLTVTAWGTANSVSVGSFADDSEFHDKEFAAVFEKPSSATTSTLSVTLSSPDNKNYGIAEIDLYYLEVEVLE